VTLDCFASLAMTGILFSLLPLWENRWINVDFIQQAWLSISLINLQFLLQQCHAVHAR
jgi:hypothetical protein